MNSVRNNFHNQLILSPSIYFGKMDHIRENIDNALDSALFSRVSSAQNKIYFIDYEEFYVKYRIILYRSFKYLYIESKILINVGAKNKRLFVLFIVIFIELTYFNVLFYYYYVVFSF